MILQENSDYVLSGKADFHSGLDTMVISQGTIVGLKHVLFFIPTSTVHVVFTPNSGSMFDGTQSRTNFRKTEQIQSFVRSFQGTVEELEQTLMNYLGDIAFQYRIDIAPLEWFEIKTGFFTGGIFMRRPGELRKVMNIRGKSNKLKFKDFYKGLEKYQ